MYLISGTLFFISSFFLFTINYYFSYSMFSEPLILLLVLISFLAGVSMYAKHHYREKEQKNEK